MKSWTDSGFRSWKSNRLFYFKLTPMEDYQGDKLFSITMHLGKRAVQYLHWYQLPKWWNNRKGRKLNAKKKASS